MKLNFSMLKNEYIGFKTEKNGKTYSFCDKLINVKQFKDHYEFLYENNKIVVENNNFIHMSFKKEKNENKYYFSIELYTMMNGLVGFTMFDTYGFPVELTKEMIEEQGLDFDLSGYYLLKELSRKKTQENSKKNSAF